MTDIDYFADSLYDINCDKCNKFLCYGFISYADDSGFLCPTCKEILHNRQAPEVAKRKTEHENRLRLEKECGESTEGHKWEDITFQTLCVGFNVYRCTKCGAQQSKVMKSSYSMMPTYYGGPATLG